MDVEKYASHNLTVYESMAPGDCIEFDRGVYSHWALCVGNGQLVHLAGAEEDIDVKAGGVQNVGALSGKMMDKAVVRVDDFWDVVSGSKARINNAKDKKLTPKSRRQIVQDALSKIGEEGYNLIWGNCEHFVSWCRYGESKSDQVETALTWAAVGTAVLGAIGLGVAVMSGDKKKEKQKD